MAVTVLLLVITTLHVVPEVELQPDHVAKVEPASASAVRVIVIGRLTANDAVHILPQLIPAGDEVTVPEPDPSFATVNCARGGGGGRWNEALTTLLVVNDTRQIGFSSKPPGMIESQPDHVTPTIKAVLPNSFTASPDAYQAKHVRPSLPQLIPAGDDVTVPREEPEIPTVREKESAGSVVTHCAAEEGDWLPRVSIATTV